MTQEQARQLKETWKGQGNQPCVHPYLAMKIEMDRYLRGHYFCLACGEKMPSGDSE